MRSPLPRAVALLRDALAARDPNWTETELAKALGVTQQAVSGWFRGRCRPRPRTMVVIEQLYGVAVREWFEFEPTTSRRAAPGENARAS